MRKSIVNSIVPPLITADKRDKDERDDYVNPSFHPEINAKSKKMRRAGSVELILYADAQKRTEKMSEKREKAALEKYKEPKIKFSLDKSEQVMAKKLDKELQEAYLQEQSSFSSSLDNKIDIDVFSRLMENLGYYSNET